MPYFDENPLLKLALQAGDAEAVLDLRGMTEQQAIQAVEQLLDHPAPARDYLVRFDPPSNDGRETLFLPLGRRLLQARRDGCLSRFLPSPDGAGYFISFAGSG
jgi:hypothetical protein